MLDNYEMDVTGLVLTLGERTTQRAIRALRRQTYPCPDVVVVRDITPFHKAVNHGVERIVTPFFIQCDADMVLDTDCVETMMRFVTDDVAVVIGLLSDPILGTVQAVKLFRTGCVREQKFPDTVSPDTDLINRLTDRGWRYVFARREQPRFGHAVDVLGDHQPEYTPQYVFEKFRLEGARIRNRGVNKELKACLSKLKMSQHPMAEIALIGFCRGLFVEMKNDGLNRYTRSPDYDVLDRLLAGFDERNADFLITLESDETINRGVG